MAGRGMVWKVTVIGWQLGGATTDTWDGVMKAGAPGGHISAPRDRRVTGKTCGKSCGGGGGGGGGRGGGGWWWW